MPVAYRHADIHIQITTNGKDWEETEVRKGCTGMDGAHLFLLPDKKITGLNIALDGASYQEEAATGIRVLSLEVYKRP
jgi:hypothetical protein